MLIKKLKYILLGLSLLVLAGCIKEDMSDCDPPGEGVVLKFRYADVRQQGETPQVDHLAVFIFDRNGVFVASQVDSPVRIDDDYTMMIGYTQGEYQFVVWAGLDDQSYELSDYIPGVARSILMPVILFISVPTNPCGNVYSPYIDKADAEKSNAVRIFFLTTSSVSSITGSFAKTAVVAFAIISNLIGEVLVFNRAVKVVLVVPLVMYRPGTRYLYFPFSNTRT